MCVVLLYPLRTFVHILELTLVKVTKGHSLVLKFKYQRWIRGLWPKEADPYSKKSAFWDIKLKIFGAEGAENFEKNRFLRKIGIFLRFMGKFGQILINIVILDQFGYKILVFFDFE